MEASLWWTFATNFEAVMKAPWQAWKPRAPDRNMCPFLEVGP